MTETAQETLSQMSARFAAQTDSQSTGPAVNLPEIGPAVITGLAAVTCLLAAIAAWCAARAGALSPSRLVCFGIILVILGLGFASALSAPNRFVATVGLCDIGMALIAGWTVALLCHQHLLGDAGRRIVVAAIIAILAVWTTKGIYQWTERIPRLHQKLSRVPRRTNCSSAWPGPFRKPRRSRGEAPRITHERQIGFRICDLQQRDGCRDDRSARGPRGTARSAAHRPRRFPRRRRSAKSRSPRCPCRYC